MPKADGQLTEAEMLVRDWDKAWNNICAGQGGEPANHPKADHPYNINRKKHIAQNGSPDDDPY